MCSICENFEARVAAGNLVAPSGPVAQLVEHLHGMEGVCAFKSRRVHPELSPWALGGVVAGEGSFSVTLASKVPRVDGSARLRFVFSLTMAARDCALVEALRDTLGTGSVLRKRPRNPRHLPQVQLTISGRRSHHQATIPFMERYLLPCAKRDQFERWRDALYEHEAAHPNRFGMGPSPCAVEGCQEPVRGRGLCRSHYYRATGY